MYMCHVLVFISVLVVVDTMFCMQCTSTMNCDLDTSGAAVCEADEATGGGCFKSKGLVLGEIGCEHCYSVTKGCASEGRVGCERAENTNHETHCFCTDQSMCNSCVTFGHVWMAIPLVLRHVLG